MPKDQEHYLKHILPLFLLITLLVGCKTIDVKNKETVGNIVFKNQMNLSREIADVYVAGSVKISGVKEVPPSYLKFESSGNIKEELSYFRISFIKKPIIDIYIEKDDIIFISHTSSQYVRFNKEEVNLSRLFGINLNPIDATYFLLGRIPYSDDMQLMNFDIKENRYYLELTNSSSQYDVYLNDSEEITGARSSSQFYDSIILSSIKYTKNDDDISVPKLVTLSSEEKKIAISFIINSISFKKRSIDILDEERLKEFEEVSEIGKIQFNL